MDFQLNAEQQLLQDSVRRYIDKACAFSERARSPAPNQGGGHWHRFAENGWLAAALPEDDGGLGGTVIDTTLITREFGRGLVNEPYLGCAILAAQTFVAGASPAQRQRLLPRLAEGSLRLALAYAETASYGEPTEVATRATPRPGGYTLSGRKTLVLGVPDADQLIVSARLSDREDAGQSLALFLVDARSAGVVAHPLPLHDGSMAADVEFRQVEVDAEAMLGEPGKALPALRHGLAHAVAALGSELVGCMEKAIETTADYLKIRKQFGVPIGSFQALQHRMADMAAECEMARSILYALLAAMENDQADARDHAVSQAKALIGRSAKFVCGQAIQLHGGIGMTEECMVGHFFKRAVVADILFGCSDWHEAACASELRQRLQRSASLA